VTEKYKDVDIEAVACVRNLQYSSVQLTRVKTFLQRCCAVCCAVVRSVFSETRTFAYIICERKNDPQNLWYNTSVSCDMAYTDNCAIFTAKSNTHINNTIQQPHYVESLRSQNVAGCCSEYKAPKDNLRNR